MPKHPAKTNHVTKPNSNPRLKVKASNNKRRKPKGKSK